MLTVSLLNDLPGIRHAFFTREGGVSEGLYRSLNCGSGSRDEAAAVEANRARAMSHFRLSAEKLRTVFQIHSAKVVEVTEDWPLGERPKADAMVTKRTGVALGILTADCVPVLFADPKARVIGAAHAGWKGALGGVLDESVAAMCQLGAQPGQIHAAIGPAISQPSYEVGPEFPAPFLAEDEGNSDLFIPSPREGHFLFDLKGFVGRRLKSLGVTALDMVACDTYSDPERFFSYRRSCHRGEADYGRLLSAISLES